jgi:hypothetical protein
MLGQVFERCVEKSPISVMVRAALERVLGADPSRSVVSAYRTEAIHPHALVVDRL